MKRLIFYVIPLVLLVALLGACGKKKLPDTAYGKVQGKWKLTKIGTDDNNDGIIEGSEVKPVSAAQDREITFKGDGTGLESNIYEGVKEPDLLFNWEILGADSLRLNYKANDTVTYNIVNITASDMTLTQNLQPVMAWYYYVKR